MRRKESMNPLSLSMTALLIAVTLIFGLYRIAGAEALPSPDAAAPAAVNGDFSLTGAEPHLRIAECLRVDVLHCDVEGSRAELTLPKVPPGIMDVVIFDGWHLIHGKWTQTGDNTLRVQFRRADLARLDGTVGLYLLILAERMEEYQ